LGQFPYKSFLKPIFPVGLVKTYYEKWHLLWKIREKHLSTIMLFF
jgi:hypothetical protein